MSWPQMHAAATATKDLSAAQELQICLCQAYLIGRTQCKPRAKSGFGKSKVQQMYGVQHLTGTKQVDYTWTIGLCTPYWPHLLCTAVPLLSPSTLGMSHRQSTPTQDCLT
jgi:hypothetical protein